jgi:hypothetical protein
MYVVGEKLPGAVGRSVLLHKLPVSRPAVNSGNGSFAIARPFQILRISPAPFPGIVKVKNGRHIPFTHLDKQVVQSGQNRIIIHPGGDLERGLHLGYNAPGTVGTNQDTEIVDTDAFQEVEFPVQTFAVATLTFGGQDSAVPEVSPHVIVRPIVLYEPTVPDMDERHRLPSATDANHNKKQ